MSFFVKFLIVFFVITCVMMWWKRSLQDRTEKRQASGSSRSGANSHEEQMVRCQTCQVFLPANEAISHRGKYYCCKEHFKS